MCQCLYTHVHGSIVHSQKVGATHRWMDCQSVDHTNHGTLASLRKEGRSDSCHSHV